MSNDERISLAKISEGVLFDEPMSTYTSVRSGGPASAVVRPNNTEELKEVLGWCQACKRDWFYIGRGSNLLVGDKGINGVVISLERGFAGFGMSFTRNEDVYVYAEGGVSTTAFLNWLVDEGYSGLEFMSGIPGTIGGNVVTNSGAGKESIGDYVEELTILDRNGREITLKKSAIRFSYRKLHIPRSSAIVKVTLKLKKDEPGEIKKRINKNIDKRKKTQPWESKTFGCTFKNPPRGKAGVLIEEAGLKGIRVGKARVSELHANFIINEGSAKTKDVLVLMDLIRQRVRDRFGILLEPEVHVIGEKY